MSRTIYCDTSDLGKLITKFETELSQPTMRRAMASALNKTLGYVGAETKREVNKEYAVPRSITKALTEKRATSSRLEAVAKYQDSPLPLFLFKYRAASNRYRSPVSVMVKRSNGMKTHTGSNPAMFKAYGNKIKLRDTGQRNIRGAYTVSIPQMVANEEVYDEIAKKAEVRLYKNLEHELEWRLSKL